jgi:hypothetical protein
MNEQGPVHNKESLPFFKGVDSASNTNEYQKYLLEGKDGRCVGLTTLPPSRVDCLKILGASTSCSPVQACTGTALPLSILL